MRKYGTEHFRIELLEATDSPEEREIHWIEEKCSFKNGYNATLGGDGKKYVNYDLVVETYNELKDMSQTAKKLGICRDTVSDILHSRNIDVKSCYEILLEKNGKPVRQYNLNGEYIQTFPSSITAAKEIGKIKNKQGDKGAAVHIADVCRGVRKTAYGFIWKYES